MNKTGVLPIGYSDVKKTIRTGYYVDKTKYAQELIDKENPIFVARPRRFGKSLFIDTLATIAQAAKEVFQDCYIGKSENGYTLSESSCGCFKLPQSRSSRTICTLRSLIRGFLAEK